MRGYYSVYEDGELIGEGSNLVTTAGKAVVLRYLARMISDYSGAIGVGLDGTDAAAGDIRLGIQTAKVPVIMKSVDFTNQIITFKGTLDPGFTGSIYEMGLLSTFLDEITGSYESKLLAVFDPAEAWTVTTSGGTESSLNTASRIGGTLRYATVNTVSGWIQYDLFKRLDLSGYSDVDQISFGHVSYSNRLTSLVVTFTDQAGLTSTYTQAVTSHTAGDSQPQYNIYRVARSSFTTATGFNWAQIMKVTARTNAAANANGTPFGVGGWDFIGVIDTDALNPDYVLVTRATAGTQISCTFTDVGNTVNVTAHSVKDGDPIVFRTITTTTGIVINTTYYAKTITANTFQVAPTLGGTAIDLVTNGSGTYYAPPLATSALGKATDIEYRLVFNL